MNATKHVQNGTNLYKNHTLKLYLFPEIVCINFYRRTTTPVWYKTTWAHNVATFKKKRKKERN